MTKQTKTTDEHLEAAAKGALDVSDALVRHEAKLHALRLMASSADLDDDDVSGFNAIVTELLAAANEIDKLHDAMRDHLRVVSDARRDMARAAEAEARRRTPAQVAALRRAVDQFEHRRSRASNGAKHSGTA